MTSFPLCYKAEFGIVTINVIFAHRLALTGRGGLPFVIHRSIIMLTGEQVHC